MTNTNTTVRSAARTTLAIAKGSHYALLTVWQGALAAKHEAAKAARDGKFQARKELLKAQQNELALFARANVSHGSLAKILDRHAKEMADLDTLTWEGEEAFTQLTAALAESQARWNKAEDAVQKEKEAEGKAAA
jgi:hypothetical protein